MYLKTFCGISLDFFLLFSDLVHSTFSLFQSFYYSFGLYSNRTQLYLCWFHFISTCCSKIKLSTAGRSIFLTHCWSKPLTWLTMRLHFLTLQKKWNQNIPDRNAAILRSWCHSERVCAGANRHCNHGITFPPINPPPNPSAVNRGISPRFYSIN